MATNNAINQSNPFPTFRATLAAITGLVTGDNTIYKIAFAQSIFDTMSNFSTVTYEFTAPITGKYLLNTHATCNGVAAGQTDGYISIVTTARTYTSGIKSPIATMSVGTSLSMSCNAVADMTAGDTAYVNLCILNGAKVVNLLYTSPAAPKTWFEGYLIR